MTNADKIRAMTDDEELAKFLFDAWYDEKWCDEDCICDPSSYCISCWLDWLQQEAEE